MDDFKFPDGDIAVPTEVSFVWHCRAQMFPKRGPSGKDLVDVWLEPVGKDAISSAMVTFMPDDAGLFPERWPLKVGTTYTVTFSPQPRRAPNA